MKNVKSIFFITTLLILLVGVTAISAADTTDDTTILSDVDNTIAPEVATTTSNDNKIMDTTKNIKKESKTHIVNNQTITEVFNKEGTSPYNNAGFNASLLGDEVEDGDTLDFQGQITGNYNLTINKAVNIISSTNDANISLNTSCLFLTGDYPGNHFIITHEGSYTNVTGINFYNTQLFVYNATCVTLDNITAVVYNQPIGGGVGQTSIRANSTNITVKNSNFYTFNNGGSSTLVLAWADNCTIINNTINAGGETGNLLYLTTYNLATYPPTDVIPNSNNLIINNTIGDKDLVTGGIRLGCVLTGSNNTIKSNKIYGEITGQFGVGVSEIQDTVIEDNIVTNGLVGTTNAEIRNNKIGGNSYIYYNSTVENNTFENVTLSQSDISFRANTVNGIINISSSNNNITNNTIISPYDCAICGGTNCTITNNYISTYYLAGEDAIINGTDNIVENNTPESGITLTITDETYETYFDSNGKINNPLITNYSTIILSGEFNNRIFDIDGYILNINGENQDTILKSSQIISRENSRIKVKSLKINNTNTNIENMIIFKSEYNTLERCNLNDYSTSTDNSHRTILLNGANNIITNNNINTSAPSVNINYTKTPTLPDCISIVVSSSNNNITNNKIQTIATTNNNEYGTIEAIAIQGSEDKSTENNNLYRNTITVSGSDYVYGINVASNANNNNITYNNIKVDSTIYTAGIQVISPANNNKISNNNINSTVSTREDKSAYGILIMNDSYNTVKSIENNSVENNNLRIVGYNSYGIEVYKSNNNKVSANTITITNANYATGIALTGENNNITSNKLSITGKNNQTSTSYDNILPTTAGINLVNSYDNTLSQNMMNVTKGTGIKLDNVTKTTIKNNTVSSKSSVGLNILNSQENLITLNNITTDNTNTLLINKSTTNSIDNNRFVTSNPYVIDLIESTNNDIMNNYMTGSSNFGNMAVNNPENNNIINNTPSFDNAIYINNITYTNYFDDEGNIKNNTITPDSLIIIVGDIYDKDMIFDIPVNITVYGSTPTIYNSTIIFKEGSNGSNTTTESSELTSRITLRNYEANTSSIIIENTSNINLSLNIRNEGQNSNGIKIFNSTNITLYNNSGISAYALNTTGLNVDKSSNLTLDLRTNSQYNNFIGLNFTNTENVTIFNQEPEYIRSEISNNINSTLIQINENCSNFNMTNKVIVQSSQTNCYILKINATEDKPTSNITYDGMMDIYGNYKGRNMTGIFTNYCFNSTFSGNITINQDNEKFLVYDIRNSDNNLFNTIITKIQSNYATIKSGTSLAKLINSNNNTFKNITFTTPSYNSESSNSNHGITLTNSNNNKIINNSITVNDQYSIYLINSNENIILDNYLNSTTYGDYSVIEENSENNNISNNTPVQLKLTNDNYNQYFDENAELITNYAVIEISSDIYNKDIKLRNQTYLFSKNSYQLNNVSIYLLENSENTIIEGLRFNNTDKALIINNTANIEITDNTILLPDTQGEAIDIINSDNITIKNNYIETKDLISNTAIKTTDSTNINYVNNTPIAIITDDEYNKYFDTNETFKYNTLDKIILGTDIKNKNMIFNNKIEILNPEKYTIYNGTLTLNENASNSKITNLIFNNSNDGKSTLIIKSSNTTITENQIYQINNNTKIIEITNITKNENGESGLTISDNKITFIGNNNIAIEINNINSESAEISQNIIIGTGNNNIILDIRNIENPGMGIGSNEFKLNTTQPSTVININNTTGAAAGIAFYIMQNVVVSTSIQNTTPLIQISNNPFIAYVTMNFIESKDLKGDQAVNGSPQYTMQNYPQNGIYKLVEVTTNIPEIMIVNKTYDLTFTITDLVGDDVNKGMMYVMIGEEYYLDINDSTAKFKYTPTQTKNHLAISYQYIDEEYEYAMLREGTTYVKVVEAKLTADPITATAGETINITARITADDETITDINKGKVTFKVNGKTLKDENGKVIYAKVVNGTATIEDYLVPDDWAKEGTTIQAVYSGSTQCDKLTSEKTNITVEKAAPTFTTESVTGTAGTTIQLKATITDGDKVINTGKVVFKLNGKTVKDTNGKVIYAKVVNNQVIVNYTLPADMKAKDYNITATFISSDYERLEDTKTLTVN